MCRSSSIAGWAASHSPYSGCGEPGRDLTGPGIDLLIGQPGGAIDNCGQLRPAAAVLPGKVAEGKRVHKVHGCSSSRESVDATGRVTRTRNAEARVGPAIT